MATKWLIGIIMLYVIGSLVCGVIEMTYFTQGATDTIFGLMTNIHGISFSNPLTALTDLLLDLWYITQLIFSIIIWDFSFFEGEYSIIKFAVFIPLSISFFVSFILAVRGTSSA